MGRNNIGLELKLKEFILALYWRVESRVSVRMVTSIGEAGNAGRYPAGED